MDVQPPRVLLFPLPELGHIKPMLQLAELISLSGLHVTFLLTEHTNNNLRNINTVDVQDHPGFLFRTIPDGLAEDNSRSDPVQLMNSLDATLRGSLKQLLDSGAFGPNVTCIIVDGIYTFMIDIGDKIDVPVFTFPILCASYFWIWFLVPDMIQAGELPIRDDEDKNKLIKSVPGMESFLRLRDFPMHNLSIGNDEALIYLQGISQTLRQSTRAKGVIFNIFEDLEAPIVSSIRASCNPKTYTIGPLGSHLKERLAKRDSTHSRNRSPFNICSLYSQVNTACMTWLDAQAPKSVVYVSFGSITVFSKEDIMEIWHGLIESTRPFLLAMRPNLWEGVEFSEGINERGFITKWVLQEEVLSHKAVGGYFTHNGWNSTLESIVAGVPMICLPNFGDQLTISRQVDAVWKLGIDIKGVTDRKVVEKAINELMVERKEEFAISAAKMAKKSKRSVSQGGSSYCALENLIKDIKLIRK